nr:leucine-rich repeat domain-containing protein [Lachnospiraceae bacterium]
MKKRMNVIIVCFLVLSFVFTTFQGIVVFADTKQGSDINNVSWQYEVYTENGKEYAKIKKIVDKKSKVSIPSTINGYIVKQIASSAFEGDSEVVEVVFPNTIVEIGMFAFQDCTNLEKVTFNSETSNSGRELLISTCAFNKCKKLKNIAFPDNLKKMTIENQAFDSCNVLDFDRIPCDVKCRNNAFRECNLSNVTIEGNAELENASFYGAFKYDGEVNKKIEFKKNVIMTNNYSNGALAGNPGLTEVVFKGETTLCEGAFGNDTELKKITWGKGLKAGFVIENSNMGENVFQGCDKLKTFEFLDCGEETVLNFTSFFSNLPKLDKIIYDNDVNLNYWIDAKNVVFKGLVKFNQKLSTTESNTKNIYCHRWDVDLDGLTAKNVNFYGIKSEISNEKYKISKYVSGQSGCTLNDIVRSVNIKKKLDKYRLANESIDKIEFLPKDIGLEIEASFVSEAEKENTAIDMGDGISGYQLAYANLKPDLNNDFTVKYSSKSTEFQILLEYPKLDKITAKLKKNNGEEISLPVGKNQLDKSYLEVTAFYDDETSVTITDEKDITIADHTIQLGDDNEVTVTYTNPYSGQKASTKVYVSGRKKNASYYTV